MAVGLNIVVGYAGLLDLGYVAFYAMGAYTAAWLASTQFAGAKCPKHGFGIDNCPVATVPAVNFNWGGIGVTPGIGGIHISIWLVLAIAGLLTGATGVVIGLPTLRLRGDYIAIVTLAFGEIIRVFAVNGDTIRIASGATLTAGRQGITPVDQVRLPFLNPFTQLDLRPWYWLVLVLVFIVLFIVIRLRDSRVGRAWIALREDEVAAASMGVPLVKTKLLAYTVGGAIGGVSGAFLAAYLNTVNADQFAFSFSIFVLAMVILGGLGSVRGVVLGAIVLSFVNNRLIPDVLDSAPGKLGLNFNLTDLGFGIFGFLLVIVMILRPEGLLPDRRREIELTEGIGAEETGFEVRA
jgi:branched-chain amino acid transport system permease protein